LLSCGIGQGRTGPSRGEGEEETLIRGKISVSEPSQGVSGNIGGDVGLTTFSLSRYNANSWAAARKTQAIRGKSLLKSELRRHQRW